MVHSPATSRGERAFLKVNVLKKSSSVPKWTNATTKDAKVAPAQPQKAIRHVKFCNLKVQYQPKGAVILICGCIHFNGGNISSNPPYIAGFSGFLEQMTHRMHVIEVHAANVLPYKSVTDGSKARRVNWLSYLVLRYQSQVIYLCKPAAWSIICSAFV